MVAVALVHCVQDRVDLRVDIKNIFSQNYFILFNCEHTDISQIECIV